MVRSELFPVGDRDTSSRAIRESLRGDELSALGGIAEVCDDVHLALLVVR